MKQLQRADSVSDPRHCDREIEGRGDHLAQPSRLDLVTDEKSGRIGYLGLDVYEEEQDALASFG